METTIRLEKLAELIMLGDARALVCEGLDFEYIYCRLDFAGNRNAHLANPMNPGDRPGSLPRTVPLTGQEEIIGDYLLFDYVGHTEDMLLRAFNAEEELTKCIIGEGGITNPFTTYLFAIVQGCLREYQVTYLDEHTGCRTVYDKAKEECPVDFDKEYVAQQLKWL